MGKADRRARRRNDAPEILVRAIEMAKEVNKRLITDSVIQGQCWWMNASLFPVCEKLGIPARELVGPAMFQAGPDCMDVMPFCDQNNRAQLPGLFHFWVEAQHAGDVWVLDVSTGRWNEANDLPVPGLTLAPINEVHSLPEHLIVRKSRVTRLRRFGRFLQPPVGRFWYGQAQPEMLEPVRDFNPVRPLIPTLIRNINEAA